MFSGRTEFQVTQHSRARRTVQFERKPSQRYSRRPQHSQNVETQKSTRYLTARLFLKCYQNNHAFILLLLILRIYISTFQHFVIWYFIFFNYSILLNHDSYRIYFLF